MEYNQIAAHWWVNQIRDKGPNSDALNRFENCLALTIKQMVEAKGSLSLYCDYCPNPSLDGIARYCGIESYLFPQQTSMFIQKDNISVMHGSGAKDIRRETIFSCAAAT